MLKQNLIFIILFIFNSTVYSQTQSLQGNHDMSNVLITTLDGKMVKLDDYRGIKPVYLKFWASWCQPCREQMPHLQKTFVEHGKDIKIIAVNIDVNDSPEAIETIKNEYALTAPIVIDHSGELAQAFNLMATPYHILIDVRGNIVFKRHDASEQLDKAIKLLIKNETSTLPVVSIEQVNTIARTDEYSKSKYNALFFTSTWCDWYLKKSRPEMSGNCVAAQHQVNQLYKKFPEINWLGNVSRLWTSEKELQEYKNKYKIEHSLSIDVSNQNFLKYNIKNFPTLILLHNGEEIFRTSDFSRSSKVFDAVKDLKNL